MNVGELIIELSKQPIDAEVLAPGVGPGLYVVEGIFSPIIYEAAGKPTDRVKLAVVLGRGEVITDA